MATSGSGCETVANFRWVKMIVGAPHVCRLEECRTTLNRAFINNKIHFFQTKLEFTLNVQVEIIMYPFS